MIKQAHDTVRFGILSSRTLRRTSPDFARRVQLSNYNGEQIIMQERDKIALKQQQMRKEESETGEIQEGFKRDRMGQIVIQCCDFKSILENCTSRAVQKKLERKYVQVSSKAGGMLFRQKLFGGCLCCREYKRANKQCKREEIRHFIQESIQRNQCKNQINYKF